MVGRGTGEGGFRVRGGRQVWSRNKEGAGEEREERRETSLLLQRSTAYSSFCFLPGLILLREARRKA